MWGQCSSQRWPLKIWWENSESLKKVVILLYLMSDAWPFRLLRLKFSLQILLCICYDITLEWLEYNSECSAPNPIRQEFNLSKGDFADWQVNFRCVAQLQTSGFQIPQRQQSRIPNLFDKKIQKGKHYHDSRAPISTMENICLA